MLGSFAPTTDAEMSLFPFHSLFTINLNASPSIWRNARFLYLTMPFIFSHFLTRPFCPIANLYASIHYRRGNFNYRSPNFIDCEFIPMAAPKVYCLIYYSDDRCWSSYSPSTCVAKSETLSMISMLPNIPFFSSAVWNMIYEKYRQTSLVGRSYYTNGPTIMECG